MNTKQEVPVHRDLVKQPSVPQQETAGSFYSAPSSLGPIDPIEKACCDGLLKMNKQCCDLLSTVRGSRHELQAQNAFLHQRVAKQEKTISSLKSQLYAEHQKVAELKKANATLKKENIQLRMEKESLEEKMSSLSLSEVKDQDQKSLS